MMRFNKNNLLVHILDINNISDDEYRLAKKNFPHLYNEYENIKNDNVKKSKLASLVHIAYHLKSKEEDLVFNEYNKPMLKSNDKYFNISNDGEYSVYVDDNKLIGIDIQKIKNDNLDIKNYAFTKDEIQYINRNELENLHILWTRKEAFVKMLGTGFLTNPSDINIEFCKNDELNNIVKYNDKNCYMLTKKFDNCYISVCTLNLYDDIEYIIYRRNNYV